MSDEDLRAFSLGELAEPLERMVTLHLESCAVCEAAARRIDSLTDPLLLALRQMATGAADLGSGLTGTEPEPILTSSHSPLWIGHYRILGELGRGGSSVVYKARQSNPKRVVALKVILSGRHTEPERRARFFAEAAAIARLRHPQIVQIYESGEHDGLPFLSLEFMGGGSLAQRLAGSPQPPRASAALVERLARAADYAHSQGVIHRDLKPTNILLTEEGEPKLADFGLAKLADSGVTTSGVILGTPSYMSPEQALGNTRAIGPAADVYALGAVLYELLTGRPPFQGATVLDTLEQARSQAPVPPSHLQGKLPRDLSTICLKCLEKDPSRRYSSAATMADDLHRFLEDRPVHARRANPYERARRWCRRNPLPALLFGVIVSLGAVVAAILAIMVARLSDEASRANVAERNAELKLYDASLAQAHASRWSARSGQRFQSLDALRLAASLSRSLNRGDAALEAVRDEAIACLALTDVRVVRQWPSQNRLKGDVDFDPNLERYSSVDAQGNVRINRVSDHQTTFTAAAPTVKFTHVNPLFSPDGRFLAVNYALRDRSVLSRVWNIEEGRIVREFAGSTPTEIIGFGPDSGGVVATHGDRGIRLCELSRENERLLPVGISVKRIAFSPDGRQLACAGATHNTTYPIQIVDVGTGVITKALDHPADLHALAWSPDGRLLAAACDDRRLYIWDAWNWIPQSVLDGHEQPPSAVLFSPDSRLVVSSSKDGNTRVWDAISGTSLLNASGQCIRFDSTGRFLGFHGGARVGIWELATGRECRQLRYGRLGNRTPALSIVSVEHIDFGLGGRLLAASGNDGVRFWDVAAGVEIGFLPIGRTESLFFNESGTQFFTYSRNGLRSWRVTSTRSVAGEEITIGPPEHLDVPHGRDSLHAAPTRGTKLLAVNDFVNHQIILLNLLESTKRSISHPWTVLDLDISVDGKWIVVDAYHDNLRLWNTRENRPLEPTPPRIVEADIHSGRFSPDGRWFVGAGINDYRIWRAGNWDDVPHSIPREHSGTSHGEMAFSRDGRFLAVARTSHEIELIDLDSFAGVARLLAPDARYIERLRFSPDGSQLAAATQNQAILVWDLSLLDEGLQGIGLNSELSRLHTVPVRTNEPLRVTLLPDLIEAENLKLAASQKCEWFMRETFARTNGKWSNDHELFGSSEKDGYQEFELNAPRTGRYSLGIYFTRAPDCGIITVSVDGKPVKEPYDSFAEQIVRSERIDFGTLTLARGPHLLRFTSSEKNRRATQYHYAVDCLELRCVDK